jgi:hypothetical protein
MNLERWAEPRGSPLSRSLGTKRTSCDVRYLAANGGKADMAGEARFRSD